MIWIIILGWMISYQSGGENRAENDFVEHLFNNASNTKEGSREGTFASKRLIQFRRCAYALTGSSGFVMFIGLLSFTCRLNKWKGGSLLNVLSSSTLNLARLLRLQPNRVLLFNKKAIKSTLSWQSLVTEKITFTKQKTEADNVM